MKFLLTVLLLGVLVAAGGAAWLWYGITQPYQGFAPDGVFVDIPHGASSRAVGRLLQNNGVIRSAKAFELYARHKSPRNVQAGEYFFDHPTSGREVFWKLVKGDVYEEPFTVKEGDTMFDIAKGLQKAKLLTEEEFLATANNPALIRDIAPDAPTLEGFLFPATYHLSRHPVATDLAAEMVKKFREEWAAITVENATAQSAENAGASSKDEGAPTTSGTASETTGASPVGPSNAEAATQANKRPVLAVVTLASLVERETPRPEERSLVAGAFTNRLQKGMLLQCDPTVVYGMERVKKFRGTLLGKDLRFDSPYNTYEHTGLPPGPIANPGEASLRAALQPAKTDYIYFVANTHGGHFFAGTLAEHNRNVLKYRHLLEGGAPEPTVAAPPPARTSAGPRKGAAQ
ncbi:MAG TPA: endolytic transglycosylase MltG [Candidatus Dormibacteraeota bacterium]|nr:endolytic transglycosylase MltG [Candidatus Dormibacteraeota bacterium]